MIPDKIYIPTEYTDNDITPVGVTLQQVFPNDVCYIRKEALLEWATTNRDKLDVLSDNDAVRWGQRNAFQQMIDKLNQM